MVVVIGQALTLHRNGPRSQVVPGAPSQFEPVTGRPVESKYGSATFLTIAWLLDIECPTEKSNYIRDTCNQTSFVHLALMHTHLSYRLLDI